MHQNLTKTPPNWLPHFILGYLLHRQPRFSSSFSNAWTAPPDARVCVLATLQLVATICFILSLQFCNSAFSSLFFHRVVAPISVLVRLTYRHGPWASLPLLARVAAPPTRSSARCRAACPHVGLSPQPTLEAPREGLRQGEVGGGGGWREAESNLASKPNDAQWRAPTDGAPTGSVANERQTPCGSNFPMQRMNYKSRTTQ